MVFSIVTMTFTTIYHPSILFIHSSPSACGKVCCLSSCSSYKSHETNIEYMQEVVTSLAALHLHGHETRSTSAATVDAVGTITHRGLLAR